MRAIVLEALNFAPMETGQVNCGRFGLVQDVVYSDPGISGNLSGPLASKVDVDINMLTLTTAIGYRVDDENGWSVEP